MKTDVRPLLTFVVTGLLFVACSTSLPYPGLTALEIYNIGVQAMEEERWGAAVDAFEAMVLTSGFEFAAEARLRLAQSEFERENFIESRAEFQRTIDRFPADTTAPHAALGVCRSLAELSPIPHRDQSFTRQAGTSCRQVASEYAGTVVGLRAAELSAQMLDKLAERDYNTGLHYLKRGLLDSALLYFDAVENTYAMTIWVPWALMKKIEVFEKFGYQQDIEETREKLLELYPDSEPAALVGDTAG
jgi:outer membrane assembly lipoprotein YfiO